MVKNAAVELRYRSVERLSDLGLNECTVRATQARSGAFWWQLWCFVRCDDGCERFVGAPVAPNGAYHENGPGGRTWGLARAAPGRWQVSPSIDVLTSADGLRQKRGLSRQDPSLWHQTPALVEVPDGEPWQV